MKRKALNPTRWPEGLKSFRMSIDGRPDRVELGTDEGIARLNKVRENLGYAGRFVADPYAHTSEVSRSRAVVVTPPHIEPMLNVDGNLADANAKFHVFCGDTYVGKIRGGDTVHATRKARRLAKERMENGSTLKLKLVQIGLGEERHRAHLKQLAAQKELEMSKKNKTKQPKDKGEEVAVNADRPTWHTHSMTAIIRHCGSRGYNRKQTEAVLEHCGLKAAPATIHIQLGKGRKGESPVDMNKADLKELEKIAKSVPAEKESKGSSKKSKKSGKKSKKAREEEQAEQDASDEVEETDEDEADDEPDPETDEDEDDND